MTKKLFGFENTDGRTIAASEAPSLTGASQQANGTWSFNAARARLEGATGLRAVIASVTTTISRFVPTASNVLMSIGFGVRVEQLPDRTFHAFASPRSGSGPAIRLVWKVDGNVGMRGTGTTTPEVLADRALTIGKMYWVTMLINVTSSTVTARFYDVDTRALAATITSNGVLGIGTTAISAIDLGWINTDSTQGHAVNFDSLVLDDGGTTELFPDSWSGVEASVWRGGALAAGTLKTWINGALGDIASRVG